MLKVITTVSILVCAADVADANSGPEQLGLTVRKYFVYMNEIYNKRSRSQ